MPQSITIDPQALERLRTFGGQDILTQLLTIYQRDMPQRLQLARQALKQDDYEEVADLVHAMRSSAGNLGVTQIVELTRAIESAARQRTTHQLTEQLDRLETLYQQSIHTLKNLELSDA